MKTYEGTTMLTPADNVPGPEQGHWTYDSYAALPDDGKRYEILDGVLYMAPPSPSGWHQQSVVRLSHYLFDAVELAGLGRVFVAPFDVELSPGTVVQPDVVVLLNKNSEKYVVSRIIGGPDLVIEIISPGTAYHDRLRKYNVYARAGVKEYWIVEPIRHTVEVFVLGEDAYHTLGTFSGKQALPSSVIPDFPVYVEQFFA
ncbi:MAG TPA: Uma2 family endonuclease [Ktedonobacteraceae bacterium]|nr:Uma2 family endonuclease [Ktedonobacteraceae bacterium]